MGGRAYVGPTKTSKIWGGCGGRKNLVQKELSEQDHFQVCGEYVLTNEAALGNVENLYVLQRWRTPAWEIFGECGHKKKRKTVTLYDADCGGTDFYDHLRIFGECGHKNP